jgi:hypothetical protein
MDKDSTRTITLLANTLIPFLARIATFKHASLRVRKHAPLVLQVATCC